jgi:glucokinase
MTRVLAVDLGGTKTSTAVFNDTAEMADRRKHPAAHTLEGTVAQVASAAKEANVEAVGVIVPGIYTERTGNAWAPNLWGRDEVPLHSALMAAIRAPVLIDSDRSGYVLGEQWAGAARGLSDVVFVAVGTGIGIGILSEGRVVRGARGIAGAAGWMALDPRWKNEYEAVGCWEAESAGPGVARRAGMGSAEEVVAAARRDDAAAVEALRAAAVYLGMGVANLISLLDPQMVVLGGGLMQAGDLLLGTVRTEAARWAQPIAMAQTRIELTALGEDAGLFGAARLAFMGTRLNAGAIHVS